MIDIFEINKFLVILINIMSIWLSFLVYTENRTKEINKTFGFMVILMLICVDFAFLARFIYFGNYISDKDIYLSFLFLKVAWFATPLFFLALYLLVIQIIGKKQQYRLLSFIITPLAISVSLAAGFTNFIVQDISFGHDFLKIVYGGGMLFFVSCVFLLIAVTLFVMLKEYFSVSRKEKEKVKYFLSGLIIFYSAVFIFNIIFPVFIGEVRYYFVGYYSSIVLIFFIAYAIIKKRLFNIKIIFTALLVSYISILLALDILAFTQSSYLKFFKAISLAVFIYLGRKLISDVLTEEERMKEKEKLARDLETANSHLKELVDMKASFLHLVSHQLRTPLTSMRGFISMWQEGCFDSYSKEEMAKIKERIVNSMEKLNNLVNDMVVAMESEGNIKLKFTKVDISELIKNNMELLRLNYEKKKLYLKYEESGSPRKIEADQKYLNNAIMNLIDNAEKYTIKGGLKIKVLYDTDKVVINFMDTGIGIPESDKKNLFQKFSRGAKSNSINPSGSGLGLFIIKEIIKKHKGKVEFKSKGANKGATFTVALPIKQSSAS